MNTKPLRYWPVIPAIFILLAVAVFAADEIAVTARLSVENGDFKLNRQKTNSKFAQAASGADYHIQDVGTNAEPITVVSDVASNGWAFIQNVTTNTDRSVDVALTLRLGPGEFFVGPLHPTNAVMATANGAAVNVECWINER